MVIVVQSEGAGFGNENKMIYGNCGSNQLLLHALPGAGFGNENKVIYDNCGSK